MSHRMSNVVSFSIPYGRYLNEQGEPEQIVPDFAKDKSKLIAMYENMVLSRLFDKKAIALQRTGKIGTYPSVLGAEAIGTGIGMAMQPDDIYCPYYREHGTLFLRGVTLVESLLYWGGDERGNAWQHNQSDLPYNIPIASQTLQAAGVATAIQIRQQPNVVVTAIGDGGTSRGDFYEALNVAGVWQLPMVFLINNNQWAISVPISKQTHAQTLAQKAIAAGIEGWQVDGNDVLAVTEAIRSAIEKARSGKGPTVVEALSYRMSDHTTADDASRYRSQQELEKNARLDPVLRLQRYLVAKQFWDETQEKQLHDRLSEQINQAVVEYEQMPPQPPQSIFDYLYETLPTAYQSQRSQLLRNSS